MEREGGKCYIHHFVVPIIVQGLRSNTPEVQRLTAANSQCHFVSRISCLGKRTPRSQKEEPDYVHQNLPHTHIRSRTSPWESCSGQKSRRSEASKKERDMDGTQTNEMASEE